MKQTSTLILFLTFLSTSFAQFFPGGLPGAGQVVTTVGTIGRNIYQAKQMQEQNKEREEFEANYAAIVADADTLYNRGKYEEAISGYNLALSIKQEQYPKDQIGRATIEIARARREAYQLLIDKSDSLYAEMSYDAAIAGYKEALSIKSEQYPNDQVLKANAEIARWKKVHFSGLLISDTRIDELSSKAYSDDPYSDFVRPGKYASMEQYLTYSGYQVLDGIAVPANTRLIVYNEQNFKGKVLLDVTGPAIISNSRLKNTPDAAETHVKNYSLPVLQSLFPQSVRQWSATDMQTWLKGSMEIIAD